MTQKKGRITYITDTSGNRDQLLPETQADIVKITGITGITASDVQGALEELYTLASTGGVTGVKGEAESTYRKGNVNITKANIGLGNVDNTADSVKNVATAVKATEDGDGNNIVATYATKTQVETAQQTADDAKSIAEGRARAQSFATFASMQKYLQKASPTEFKIGDNLFIQATGTPDYWISRVLTEPVANAYGWYEISPLETQKVDLSAYQTKEDTSLQTTSKTVVGAINELNNDVTSVSSDLSTLQGDFNTLRDRFNSAEVDLETAQTDITNIKTDIADIEAGTTKAGYAIKADRLATARTITFTGAATGSYTFDGSANKSVALTLANSGVTAGSYSAVNVNSKGLVTSGGKSIEIDSGNHTPSANLMVGGIFLELF